MSKADIWMPFYVSDYLADTMHLSAAEHGAYLMLILHYWKSGPIPFDHSRLSIISKLGDAWSNASSTLVAFFEQRDGMLYHNRIDKEKLEASENKDRNKARALLAANKRWSNNAPSIAPSIQQALLNECPSPSPSSLKIIPSSFDEFWCKYPKRKAKGDAEKAWLKIKPNEELLAKILLAVDLAKNCDSWLKDNGQYIPYPASWLNSKGWLDENGDDSNVSRMKWE